MGFLRLFECPDCGHRWQFLAMKRADKSPPCANCAAKPVEALAAPSLNRGAVPDTRIKVPTDRTKRIDFAQRIIAEDHNVTNLRSNARPGEVVAMPGIKPQDEARSGSGAGSPQATRTPVSLGAALA